MYLNARPQWRDDLPEACPNVYYESLLGSDEIDVASDSVGFDGDGVMLRSSPNTLFVRN